MHERAGGREIPLQGCAGEPSGGPLPRLQLCDLPGDGRHRVGASWRSVFKSRRKGLRALFVHDGCVYKVYDPEPRFARRAGRIGTSAPLVGELASQLDGVLPWTALIVDDRARVVGYRMPWVEGRSASAVPEAIPACRELYLRIDRRLAERGFYWQDPKPANFVWEAARRRVWAVDLKQLVPIGSAEFDPERMLNSPRSSKLRALGLSSRDYEELAALRARLAKRGRAPAAR